MKSKYKCKIFWGSTVHTEADGYIVKALICVLPALLEDRGMIFTVVEAEKDHAVRLP
jgi:hypothetical protein